LDARLLTKTFWTLSAWSYHDAMTRFVHQPDLPLDWTIARARIADAT